MGKESGDGDGDAKEKEKEETVKPKKGKNKGKGKGKSKGKGKGKAVRESPLKQWMDKNEVYEKTLYSELLLSNVESLKQVKALSQSEFDDIVRKVRVARMAKLKDQKKKAAIDQQLIKFEKLARKTKKKKKNKKKWGCTCIVHVCVFWA